MARLYGLTGEPEHPAQVPLGQLPARFRKGAPEWENAARKRMHNLLDRMRVVTAAEGKVLTDAQIPLKPRPKGAGHHIDPAVARHRDDTRALANVSHAMGMARLYGLTGEPEHPAQVPLGQLPTWFRKGAPEWENAARRRMHDLLAPRRVVSAAEGKVLADAQIPLKSRPKGAGHHIDPAVARHRDDTRAVANVGNATRIAAGSESGEEELAGNPADSFHAGYGSSSASTESSRHDQQVPDSFRTHSPLITMNPADLLYQPSDQTTYYVQDDPTAYSEGFPGTSQTASHTQYDQTPSSRAFPGTPYPVSYPQLGPTAISQSFGTAAPAGAALGGYPGQGGGSTAPQPPPQHHGAGQQGMRHGR